MSLDIQGFLSPDIQKWIAKHRADHARTFALTDRLSALLLKAMLEAKPDDSRSHVVMAMLLARAVGTFQSLLILAERGLTADARTLVRSFLETTLYFGGAKSDPKFVELLVDQDKDHKRKVATKLLKLDSDASGLSSQDIQALRDYEQRRQLDRGKPIEVANLAQKLGLEPIYDTYYRGLSGDAAHPTITSLNRHAISDADGNLAGLKWRPEALDVGETLMDAASICFYLLLWVYDAFFAGHRGADFEQCWSQYKTLQSEQVAIFAAKRSAS